MPKATKWYSDTWNAKTYNLDNKKHLKATGLILLATIANNWFELVFAAFSAQYAKKKK